MVIITISIVTEKHRTHQAHSNLLELTLKDDISSISAKKISWTFLHKGDTYAVMIEEEDFLGAAFLLIASPSQEGMNENVWPMEMRRFSAPRIELGVDAHLHHHDPHHHQPHHDPHHHPHDDESVLHPKMHYDGVGLNGQQDRKKEEDDDEPRVRANLMK